ncbi:hypothetical protein [Streptomyces sp. NPDC051677]|uniref:hypothetical protein n=1 Tax=Streptomyces sp. NPDC051677 TaxID=3365669 RepID=UPI0037CF907B
MADKQDRWLDRETAERLLRGESPGRPLDGPAEEQAERLARTLGALSALAAEPLPADEELPGEAAALAAFRKTHADRADLARAAGEAHAVDVGLVRIAGGVREAGRRPRRIRPARLGLAAALTAGVLGGVAVGTGVLPTPFDGAEPARPSVSAPAFPDRPLVSPSPDGSGGAAPSATPEGGTGDTGNEAGEDAGNGTADDDATAAPDLRGAWPSGVTSSCRDLSAGKTLDPDRRRILENLAGGSKRIRKYCAGVLDNPAAGSPRGDARTGNGTAGRDTGQGQGDRDGQGGSTRGSGTDDKSGRGGGTSDDEDDGGHRGGGHGHGRGGGGHGRGRG